MSGQVATVVSQWNVSVLPQGDCRLTLQAELPLEAGTYGLSTDVGAPSCGSVASSLNRRPEGSAAPRPSLGLHEVIIQ